MCLFEISFFAVVSGAGVLRFFDEMADVLMQMLSWPSNCCEFVLIEFKDIRSWDLVVLKHIFELTWTHFVLFVWAWFLSNFLGCNSCGFCINMLWTGGKTLSQPLPQTFHLAHKTHKCDALERKTIKKLFLWRLNVRRHKST